MNQINTIILFFSILFTGFSVFSEPVDWDDLVERNGLHFKKYSDQPYSGQLISKTQNWILAKGNFKNGLRDGKWVWFHPNGQLKTKKFYKEGMQDGLSEAYNRDGILTRKLHYKSGKLHGPYREYFEKYNGSLILISIGNFKDDKKDGLWKYYEEVEEPFCFLLYEEYSPDYDMEIYKHSGLIKLREMGHYKNGKKDGIWEENFDCYTSSTSITYKDGTIISEQ